ncbi:hypothetical protein [Paenibacillus contaminans]|uniref:Uncharacterized protein n=1 Tax=Paenibacillus contaminans TaxID=450362 RepID=A0A329MSA6_9BACL|nr:hypothetical protein [Paenibacillus contaminans]RAV22674.1 hypothetical protein DQG23_00185 [Paenibacillus contaminans]
MLITLEEANGIFQYMLEGKEWDRFSDGDKQRSLGTAKRQFSNYPLQDGADQEEKVKQAFCLQALYLLIDEDRLDLEKEKRNGLISQSTDIDKISTSYTRTSRILLYPEVYEMIYEHLELWV